MITLRTRIFVLISLVVFVILAISIALVVIKKKSAEPITEEPLISDDFIDESNFPAQIITPPTQVPVGATVKTPTTEEMMINAAKQTAKIFVERYMTYSTDNENENIYAVQTIVSPSLWQDISRHIGSPSTEEFVGVTTKVIAIDVSDFANDKAIVDISAQRIITNNAGTERTNEKITVMVVKINDQWLVDSYQ